MDALAIKQIGKTLARLPWMWKAARSYVRYSPRRLVVQVINDRVNKFYVYNHRRFIVRTIFGSRLAGDTADIIQRYVFLYGLWEPNLTRWLKQRLRRGDVFVDVGANVGYFSLLAARLVGKEGRVVAVEASPSIFAQLTSNIMLNGLDNVRLLNCAAAAAGGTLRLFRAPAHNLGASSIYADAGYEDEGAVEAQPLHSLLTANEIVRARMIKIDVEGAEPGVVLGLVPLLVHARADLEIVIEVGGGPKGSPSAAAAAGAIVPLLTAKGFHVYRLTNDYLTSAYGRRRKWLRPERVRNIASITEECDLVFSRLDAPQL